MHFLVDVHLPISLSKFLDKQENCVCTYVNQILQKWHTPDSEISKYADENHMVVITKDQDFKTSHFINKTPKRIIRITLGNISNKDLLQFIEMHLQLILSLSTKDSFYIEVGNNGIIAFG
jgi:predicted nuclease of predicted toxin-antitoxin system